MQQAIVHVLIADDYSPMRGHIALMLQGRPQLRIVSEVADGINAVHMAETLQPDLILMDIGLPGMDGIEAARRIVKVAPKSKILFVTENCSLEVAEEALRSGGLGYVLKSAAEKDLLPAIDAVLRGNRFVSASIG